MPHNFTQNCKNCLQESIRKVPVAILGLRLPSVRLFSFVSLRHSVTVPLVSPMMVSSLKRYHLPTA